MGATFKFIKFWLIFLEENYGTRRVAFSTVMKELFKTIPTTITKPLSPRNKFLKSMKEIGGGWYLENITEGMPPISISKLSKNHKRRRINLKKTI